MMKYVIFLGSWIVAIGILGAVENNLISGWWDFLAVGVALFWAGAVFLADKAERGRREHEAKRSGADGAPQYSRPHRADKPVA